MPLKWTRVLNSGLAALLATILSFSSVLAASTFHRGTFGDPETLDPHKASAQSATPIIYDMFEGLMSLDGEGRVVPGVAREYTVSEDGLTYTFHLRKNLQWSDGTPITAEDFVYSNRRLMKPETAGRFASFLYPIKNARMINHGKLPAQELGVRSLDDLTVEYTLEAPNPSFPKIMATNPAVPVPRHVVEAYGSAWIKPEHIVVNGPYILNARVPQTSIKLVKNPAYRRADQIRIDEVYYHPTRNLGTSLKRFRSGELDVILNFPPSQINWIKQNIPQDLHVTPALGIYYLLINNKKAPFDDVRVREALSISIDREVITDKLLRTGVTPAYSFATPQFANYDGIDVAYRHEPLANRQTRARELLKQMGYDENHPLKVQYRNDTLEESQKIAIAVSGMWRDIGVETDLTSSEFIAVIRKVRSKDFEIARFAYFAPYNDPYTFLSLFQTGDQGNNGDYSNPEYDVLLKQSRVTRDPVARKALFENAERLLMKDYPMIPIYFYVRRYLVSPRVHGWVDTERGVNPTQYLWIDPE